MIRMKELKNKAKLLEPTIRIGKNGLTESQINEIKKQLNKKRLVKIKLLKSCIAGKDRKDIAGQIAEKTNSAIIEQVGFVFVLYK